MRSDSCRATSAPTARTARGTSTPARTETARVRGRVSTRYAAGATNSATVRHIARCPQVSGAVASRPPWNSAYVSPPPPTTSGAVAGAALPGGAVAGAAVAGGRATTGGAVAGDQGQGTSWNAASTSNSSNPRRNGSTSSSVRCRVSTVSVTPTPAGSSTTWVSRCQDAWSSPAVQEKVLRPVAARNSSWVTAGTRSTPPTGNRTSLK